MTITTQAKLDETALLELESSLRGELLRPDHPSYEEQRRVWNGSISRRPALIARCSGVADVIAAVQFARRTGLGLAVPAGIVTHTGLAGLTLGGGIGWVMRKYGLTIDQLLSVDLITADGEFVKASENENADLFWGVRGGGGNFGIVTEFEFRLNPLGPEVVAGPIFWPMEKSPEVLRFYRDWLAGAPDELMTIVVHRKAPPLPFVP